MKEFMGRDFLLKTETAQKLFYDYADKMPIFDYHCHLSPQEIYEDKTYNNITEVWLYGDHYKWRYMRSMGIEEKYCTGDASDYEKFLAYASVVAFACGNPLYHWSHLELKRFFGIDEMLTEKNAPIIWEKANAKIKEGGFSARSLIKKSNVNVIGTTDDPADDLKYHKLLKEDKTFDTKVVPTFRPDNAVNIEKDTFCQYIEKLSKAAQMEIKTFADLKAALSKRLDFFEELGAKISDHALNAMPYAEATDEEVNKIFTNALSGIKPSKEDIDKYKTATLLFVGEEYAKRGWVMQLHLAALRDNNTKMFNEQGPDRGFDSIDDDRIAVNLSRFMDNLNCRDLLPKTILYTLNPKDNFVLGTMLGNFQGGGIRGKIQFGSAWWFNDHIDGMVEQMKALGNLGALAAFVGMLTDSRSFLSYPRHEYFRRILCNIVGTWVEDGEFTSDPEILKDLIEGISYKNAEKYFGIE